MGFTRVQGAHNSSSASAASIGATGSAVGSGNVVVGVVAWGSTTNNLTSVTDDKGNTYTILDTVLNLDGESAASFCLGNITNAPSTITANFSASDSNLVIIWDEFSGALAASNPVDVHTGQSQSRPGTGTNAITSGTKTTTANSELIYGGAFDVSGGSTSFTAGTGFSLGTLDTGLSRTGASEFETQTSAGSVAATFTGNQSGADYMVFMVAVKAQAAAAPGKQRDWPIPPPLQQPDRTWTGFFNRNLIGKDRFTAGRLRDWPLPAAPEPDWRRSWTGFYNVNLIGKDTLPAGRQRDWPTPPPVTWDRFWSTNLLQTTLVPVVAASPFSQLDWPLPGNPEPDWRRSWTASYNINLIGLDQLPGRQYDWPLPIAPPPLVPSWTAFYNVNLIGQDALPFRQLDWPLPTPPPPAPPSWLAFYNRNLIGQDALPFRQMNWPLPVPPAPAPPSWTAFYNVNLIGQDQLPVRQLDWPTPPQVTWDRFFSQNLLLTTLFVVPAAAPFAQLDWPVPTPPPLAPDLFSWTRAYNPNLVGQDTITAGRQTDWPCPPPVNWDRFWSQNLLLTTLFVPPAPVPFAQLDWPLPVPPPLSPDLFTWTRSYNPNLVGLDALSPGRLLDWPTPPPAQWDRFWSQNLLLTTLFVPPVAPPFNQLDWPVPVPPVFMLPDIGWQNPILSGIPVPPPPPIVVPQGGGGDDRRRRRKKVAALPVRGITAGDRARAKIAAKLRKRDISEEEMMFILSLLDDED